MQREFKVVCHDLKCLVKEYFEVNPFASEF